MKERERVKREELRKDEQMNKKARKKEEGRVRRRKERD